MIVKRRPAVRPGKGRAAVYISGTAGASSEKPPPTVTPANNTWHRPGFAAGHISKRFDSREKEKEREESQKPVRVVSSGILGAITYPGRFSPFRKVLKSSVATDDEAAAMAAMFQAQSANWEETQEKMSQFVSPAEAGSLSCSVRVYLISSRFFSFSLEPHALTSNPGLGPRTLEVGSRSATSPRNPCRPVTYAIDVDKKVRLSCVWRHDGTWILFLTIPPGHWIQDCPTNNDRDFDNKPRIKRTTGIPRSFLKSVDSPAGQLSSGVMVTPEGGFVVAQPDS